jgi:hypothetical protein
MKFSNCFEILISMITVMCFFSVFWIFYTNSMVAFLNKCLKTED